MSDVKSGITRRNLLGWGAAATAATIAGCGSQEVGGGVVTDASALLPEDGGEGVDGGSVVDGRVDGSSRDSSPQAPDAHVFTADQLLAPIDTFVVLVLENRSFDHYLGALKFRERKAVDGISGQEWNPSKSGQQISVFENTGYKQADPPHGWDDAHDQWNNGQNDGFVRAHAGSHEREVMGYYVRGHLPAMYALTDEYAVCDRWFSSVMGPTWPNRYYIHGATSKGRKANFPITGFQSIWDQLENKGLSHKNYYGNIAWAAGGFAKVSGLAPMSDFYSAATAGRLPNFSLIDPTFLGGGANDDHPEADVRMGQALIASVYNALARSPQWSRTLFVVTYDEHGGFYDHVPPPTTVDPESGFERLGFRVPSLVCGPHVKKGTVSAQFDHVSIISTLTRRFQLTPLNARVAATNDLSACLDGALIGAPPRPAPILPPVAVSKTALLARHAAFLKRGQPVHHSEIWDSVDRLLSVAGSDRGGDPRDGSIAAVARDFDKRRRGLDHVFEELDHGARLGAVELLP